MTKIKNIEIYYFINIILFNIIKYILLFKLIKIYYYLIFIFYFKYFFILK